uniref:Uncharacterized protein n=1 Tax=Rhizophora mucronata TaxID=61149 RepID=A0A2P2QQT8_RHIMU
MLSMNGYNIIEDFISISSNSK